MSTQADAKEFSTIIKKVYAKLKPIYGQAEKPIEVRWSRERFDYFSLIQTASWREVETLAQGNLKQYQGRLKALVRLQKQVAGLQTQLDALDQLAKKLDRGRAKTQDEGKYRVLADKLREKGVPADKIKKLVAELKGATATSLAASVKERVAQGISKIEIMQGSYLSSTFGALMATKVSLFNQAFEKKKKPSKGVSTWCKEVEQGVFSREKNLWGALKANDLVKLGTQVGELKKYAGQQITRGVEHAAALACQRSGGEGTKTDDALALRVGDVLRVLLRSLALAHYLEVLARWDTAPSSLAAWLRAAKKLPYSKPPAVRSVSAVELAKKNDLRQGDAVVIHGYVQSVTIKHVKGKAVSSALIGGQAGDAILVALPYIKLDSAGLVPQAYVRISGTWTTKVDWLNKPGILIDRLDYGSLSTKNGYDWVTAELRPIFNVVPHGLAVAWSWEPGVDGAGNQLRYGVWHTRQEEE